MTPRLVQPQLLSHGAQEPFLNRVNGAPRLQALFSTFVKSDSLAPAAVAGAVSVALFTARRLGRLPAALVPLMRNLLGWTATLLFMFQPLAQLVRASNAYRPTHLKD